RLRVRCAMRLDVRSAPYLLLLQMRSAVICTRHERRARHEYCAERSDRIASAPHAGRIVWRSDDHEVVVHDLDALSGMTCSNESRLGSGSVDEEHVCITAPGDLQRLSAP